MSARLAPVVLLVSVGGAAVAHAVERVSLAPGWMLDRWSRSDGLPLANIADVAVDADGIVWLATLDGLVRFDGVTFDTLRADHPQGPASTRLLFLEFHPLDGALWVLGETSGLQRRNGGEIVDFESTANRAWPRPGRR